MASSEKTWTTALMFGATASICLTLSAAAWAEDVSPQRDARSGRGPRRPPPEAFGACEGKDEGAECSVDFHGDTLAGVCVSPPDDALFCMPNDLPPPPVGERREGPPPGRIFM
jgi:hypothetical protein